MMSVGHNITLSSLEKFKKIFSLDKKKKKKKWGGWSTEKK